MLLQMLLQENYFKGSKYTWSSAGNEPVSCLFPSSIGNSLLVFMSQEKSITQRAENFSFLSHFTLFPFSHNNAPSKLKNSRVHFATSHLLITGRRREDDIELSFCPHFHLRSNLEKQNFSHRGSSSPIFT